MKLLIALCLFYTTASAQQSSSTCRKFFEYTNEAATSTWEARLAVLSHSDLSGVWIRLFFDTFPADIAVRNNSWEVVLKHDKQVSINNRTQPHFYLIKNPAQLLTAGVPLHLEISLKNAGEKPPALIGYRLNGRTVCPEEIDNPTPANFFLGDRKDNADFLQSRLRFQDNCGTTSPKNHPSSWPWYAEIRIKTPQGPLHTCAATLISSNALLTAAHCLTSKNSLEVISPDLVQVALAGGEQGDAASIGIHPGYNWKNLENDIAVIRLLQDVKEARAICLADGSVEGIRGLVVGNAFTTRGNRGRKLEEVAMKPVSNAECVGDRPELAGFLADSSFCGKYVMEDDATPCVGESGNGFQILREGDKPVWELWGIVTYGSVLQNTYVCNQSSEIVLTDVAKHSKWIRLTAL